MLFYPLIFYLLQAEHDCASLCLNKKSMPRYTSKLILISRIHERMHDPYPVSVDIRYTFWVVGYSKVVPKKKLHCFYFHPSKQDCSGLKWSCQHLGNANKQTSTLLSVSALWFLLRSDCAWHCREQTCILILFKTQIEFI